MIFDPEQIFSLHDTRMSISFGLITEMNSFRNDEEQNVVSASHKQIHRDGMILFQNESRSGIT